jgi:hypothetical protein
LLGYRDETLVLFYRLVAQRIGYDGPILDLSGDTWRSVRYSPKKFGG